MTQKVESFRPLQITSSREDDWAANLLGRLSSRQKRALLLRLIYHGLMIALLIGLDAFVCRIFIRQPMIETFLLGLFWSIFLGALAVYHFQSGAKLWRDIRDRLVMVLSGRVHKYFYVAGGGRGNASKFVCCIYIRGESFTVSRSIYDRLSEKQKYRIYYAPNCKELLNIEIA